MGTIKRVVFVIGLVVLAGCATNKGPQLEPADIPTLKEQLSSAIDAYLYHTLGTCQEAHDLHQTGQSPVDCKWTEDLKAMFLSLPDVDYHKRFQPEIAEWRHNWCASSLAKTGRSRIYWVVRYRDTKSVIAGLCWPEEEGRN